MLQTAIRQRVCSTGGFFCLKNHELFGLVTLHHFTMPKDLILTDPHGDIAAGAWEHEDAVKRFRFYVKSVVRALADNNRVRDIARQLGLRDELLEPLVSNGIASYFLTINEPSVVLFNSYLGGIFPPYKRLWLQKPDVSSES